MDFRELKCILAVIEEGNTSKAANKLFLSQPAVSRMIAKIEGNLDTPLFNKRRTPWTLTHAGLLYVDKAKKIVEMEKEFFNDLKESKNLVKEKLTIGLMSFEEKNLMPNALPLFYKKYPDVTVELVQNTTSSLEKMIINNEIDFAIPALPLNYIGIEHIPISTYNILLALPLEHPLAKSYKHPANNKSFPTIDLKLLANDRFITLKPDRPLRKVVIVACEQNGFSPNIVLEAHNFDAIHSFVVAGYGNAFILDQIIPYYRPSQRAAYFKVKDMPLKQEIVFAYKKGKKLSNIEKDFLEILLQENK